MKYFTTYTRLKQMGMEFLHTKNSKAAYSLIETMVVVSIVSFLSVMVTMSFQSVVGPVFNGQVSSLTNSLARARAYAMANNTYVFVGIQELDASRSVHGAQSAGIGRIALTILASNDGTKGYPASISTNTPLTTLTAIYPLQILENIHLMASASPGLTLPNTNASGETYLAASTPSLTTFTWPPGSTVSNYPAFGTNGTVIQFNPRGEAQIITGPYADSNFQWIEIDLISTHGTKASTIDPATILIDGASGGITAYFK